MNRTKQTILLACTTIALTVAGCQTLTDLQANRQLWDSQGINSYSFELQVSCFCISDITRAVRIVVMDGEAVSITYIDTGMDANDFFFNGVNTIEKLFGIIQDGLEINANSIMAIYDPDFGYPIEIQVDPFRDIADDEITVIVSAFQSLR